MTTPGLTIVNNPPLHLVHYDLPPDLASLTNNGHTAKLSTKHARYHQGQDQLVDRSVQGGGDPHHVWRGAASRVQTIPTPLSLGTDQQRGVRAQVGGQLLPHGAAPGPLQGWSQ